MNNPEVVAPINALVKGGLRPSCTTTSTRVSNWTTRSAKRGGCGAFYGEAQTPLARVLARAQVTAQTKQRPAAGEGRLESLCLKASGGP